MTYNEWRDELKNNLLCVSEAERRRVLDYYAEAYADRREAGFTEREIIQDFGAPYDAAQRILREGKDDGYDYDIPSPPPAQEAELTRRQIRKDNREARREEHERRERERREERERARHANDNTYYAPPSPAPEPAPAATVKNDYTWVFVLLCIIFAFPLFGLIMGMVGITIGFCVAPIAVIGVGAAGIGAAFEEIFSGQVAAGFCEMGIGIVILGVGVALCPVFFNLVKLMWTVFQKFFAWLKSLFKGGV